MKVTRRPGPGTGQKVAGRSGRFRQLAWASVPLWSFGFLAFVPFLCLAVIRRRIRDWAVFGAYLAVAVLFAAYFAGPDSGRHAAAAGGVLVLFMVIAAVHAFVAFSPGPAPVPSPESHARTSLPGPGVHGPGAVPGVVDRSGRVRQLAWASVPVWSFGFFSFAPFFYVAVIRRRIRDWAVFAVYLAVLIWFIGSFSAHLLVWLLYFLLIGFAAAHVFIVLRPGSFPAPWRDRRAAGLASADPAVPGGVAVGVADVRGGEPAANGLSGMPDEPGASRTDPGVLRVDHVQLSQRKRFARYVMAETGWLILTGTGEVRFYKRLPAGMTATPDLRAPSAMKFAEEIWDGGVHAHFGDQARNVLFTGAESPAISDEKLDDIGTLGESAASLGDSSGGQALSLGGDAVSLAVYVLQVGRASRARRRKLAVMRAWYPVLLGERPWPTLGVIKAWPPTISEQALDEAQVPRDLAEAADELAVAVGAQWEAEAAVRGLNDSCPLPVRWVAADACLAGDWDVLVSVAGSGAGRAPPSPPGSWATGPDQLAGRGNHLVTVLAQVPTGRLVVLGEPGSGKTMLMVRLVLDLLAARTSGAPVPVLASLASWNPSERDLHGWLADQLALDHPALDAAGSDKKRPGRIAALLSAGLIVPILDGLDEIPEQVRGPVITQINDSLRPASQLILTCRTGPYRDAVQPPDDAKITLEAAAVIQLCPLDAADVARYLRHDAGGAGTQARWDPVLATLGTKAPAGLTLVTPLMVDLARAIYTPRPGEPAAEPRDPAELCRLHDRAAVEAHLLDAFIPAAYQSRPASRWDARQAESWLVFLARHLETTIGSPDLAWWQLAKAGPSAGLRLAAGLAAALVAGAAAGFAAALVAGAAAGAAAGLLFGFGGALGSAFVAGKENSRPVQPVGIHSLAVFLFELVVVVVAGIAIFEEWWHLLGTFGKVLAWATVFLSAFGLKTAYDRAAVPGNLAEAASPRGVLTRDRRGTFHSAAALGFRVGLLPGLVVGVIVWAVAGPVPGLVLGFVFGYAFPTFIALYLMQIKTAWLSYSLVRGWLALHRRLPWSLMDFLAGAHQRGILQQAGSVYQFRHIELQHRLATRP